MADEHAFSATLGFLLIQVIKAHHDRARTLLGELGLHVGQDLVLLSLRREDGLSQSALAEKLHIQPATLTRSLSRMERSGLSERRVDGRDRRVTRVYITEHGRALCPSVVEAWQQLETETFANLSAEEQDTLRLLLQKAKANLGGEQFHRPPQ